MVLFPVCASVPYFLCKYENLLKCVFIPCKDLFVFSSPRQQPKLKNKSQSWTWQKPGHSVTWRARWPPASASAGFQIQSDRDLSWFITPSPNTVHPHPHHFFSFHSEDTLVFLLVCDGSKMALAWPRNKWSLTLSSHVLQLRSTCVCPDNRRLLFPLVLLYVPSLFMLRAIVLPSWRSSLSLFVRVCCLYSPPLLHVCNCPNP